MKQLSLIIISILFVACSSEDDSLPPTLAEVSTSGVLDITQTSANSGGEITSSGGEEITAKGVVWSTEENPTIDLQTKTNDGTGDGSFTSIMNNLSGETTYYVRAYATNSVGTAYGQEITFTTPIIDYAAEYPEGTVFCDGVITEIIDVTNPVTGKIWMDRNLGASQAATSSTDAQAYGDLYQWGRGADGHQCRDSETTSSLSSTDQPGHGDFILAPNSPFDWRSPQNTNLWQGVNGVNNPCPSGYRLPTETELNAERASWSSNNAAGAFASPLKLPLAGNRLDSLGSLNVVGTIGLYWSSTVSGANSRDLVFGSSNAGMLTNFRASGLSVRCIKD